MRIVCANSVREMARAHVCCDESVHIDSINLIRSTNCGRVFGADIRTCETICEVDIRTFETTIEKVLLKLSKLSSKFMRLQHKKQFVGTV